MSVAGWIVLAVLAVALVVAEVGWLRASAARKRVEADLGGRLEREQAAHTEAAKANDHLETRMRTLRNELAEAHQTNTELTARIGRSNPADASRALGLWALERHRQARLASTPLLGIVVGPGADLGAGLAEAIRLELEVLREDVGTHAELADLDLGDTVDPHEALTILRIVQELTATLAKRADELAVFVGREDRDITVRVAAIGWNDAPPNATAFESGLAALDGTLDLRPDPDTSDTLLAVVRL
ncbi:MAG: hypothetical protein ACXV8T_12345, partial [Acidimicrobiia bacterium]